MKLSIIIPVFNEEKTIREVVRKIQNLKLSGFDKEIIIVNDGSTDSSGSIIKELSNLKGIFVINKEKNQGKGSAVRAGIEKSKGEYILIQDADLEYHPNDIQKLLTPIKEKTAEVVYGTRLKRLPDFARDERNLQFATHYLGNKLLSLITSILYGQFITDMETGYKLFPKALVKNMKLKAKSFEFEPEITAKILKKGVKIKEIQITTNPRGYKEGKKLHTVKDGSKALFALLKYRFVN